MTIQNVPAITIHTLAYNVEKYIRECADSVLNQTFTNFEWVVMDNGSTDQTGIILEEYASKDNRIKLFKNQRNSFIYNEPMNPDFEEYCINQKYEYWCMLDSDDYLHPDFLKDLYTAAIERNADIAVGGTEMFNETNPTNRGKRCPPDFYTKDITVIGDMFPEVYGTFRPMWGKVVKYSVIQKQVKYRLHNPVVLKNAGDTLFCLDLLSFSNSVVGINRVLHYYRIRSGSLFHAQVDKHRYLDHLVIYQESKKLLQNWNKLNTKSENFIAGVLYSSLNDCLKTAINATSAKLNERLEVVETILSDKTVNESIKKFGLSQQLFIDLQQLMNLMIDNISDVDVPIATTHYSYRLFLSIKMALSVEGNKQNAFLLYISALCDEMNKYRFGATLLDSFFALIGKNGLAVEYEKNGLSHEFLASNPRLFREIINGNFEQAVGICELNSGQSEYDALKKELINSHLQNAEMIHVSKELSGIISNAKELIEKNISNENFDEAIELLLSILAACPLDKEALYYKMYFLSMNRDLTTLTETAVALINFYPDDFSVLVKGAQALVAIGLKEEARDVYQKALKACSDESQQFEIIRELEAI